MTGLLREGGGGGDIGIGNGDMMGQLKGIRKENSEYRRQMK